eukprot:521748-Pyramimonas_sp.AAC.1
MAPPAPSRRTPECFAKSNSARSRFESSSTVTSTKPRSAASSRRPRERSWPGCSCRGSPLRG